jgi:hypothetical protein
MRVAMVAMFVIGCATTPPRVTNACNDRCASEPEGDARRACLHECFRAAKFETILTREQPPPNWQPTAEQESACQRHCVEEREGCLAGIRASSHDESVIRDRSKACTDPARDRECLDGCRAFIWRKQGATQIAANERRQCEETCAKIQPGCQAAARDLAHDEADLRERLAACGNCVRDCATDPSSWADLPRAIGLFVLMAPLVIVGAAFYSGALLIHDIGTVRWYR